MRMLRSALAMTAAALAALGAAHAQTVKIGKIPSGNGFHIPSYVAMLYLGLVGFTVPFMFALRSQRCC